MALSCGSKVIKYLLFFFNLIFWLSGVVLLGIGIWILAAHSNAVYYLHIADLDYGLVKASAITIIIVGALVFIVGGLGCCGACKENAGCLCAFSIILIILLVLQLIAITLAGALHSQIIHELGKAMSKTMINDYGQSGHEMQTQSWNVMQIEMKCCGVNDGPTDWINTNWWNNSRSIPKVNEVPQSCCAQLKEPVNFTNPQAINPSLCFQAAFNKTMNITERNYYVRTMGCEVKLNDWFMDTLSVLIGGVVAVIVIQIVVVIMACVLKSNIKNEYEYV